MPAKQTNPQLPAQPTADLMTALHHAQDIARVKSGLLASVSHEIRTPLAGVMGFAELLLDSSLTPQQRSYANAVTDSGHAIMRLLNDLLDISQIEVGKLQLTCEPVHLQQSLQDSLGQMEPVAHAKGLQLTLWIDPELPAGIAGDALRLRQIVTNLIGNALKFADTGRVAVVAQPFAKDPQLLSITVTDNGSAEPPAQLDQIFGQSAQLDDGHPRRDGGSGLGLAISSELAQLMGGRIEAPSEAKHSTTTTTRLLIPLVPAVLPKASRVEPQAAAPQRLAEYFGPLASDFAQRGQRPRVLVAEDNDINQQLILVQAERAGIFAEIVDDGAQAVAMVKAAARAGDPYRLVLMDMRMPVMDGLEATRNLRAAGFTPQDLPIVALSAHAQPENRDACKLAGMQDHIAKPMSNAALRSAIQQWVVAAPADHAAEEPPALALNERYAAMKRDTAALTLRLMRSGECSDFDLRELTGQLHKICGTAAYFDEAWLGTAAGELEQRIMRADPAAKLRLVAEAHQTLSLAN